jgi:hypothetical protein
MKSCPDNVTMHSITVWGLNRKRRSLLGPRLALPQHLPPLPWTPHKKVLVHGLHGDLSGIYVRVEALQ